MKDLTVDIITTVPQSGMCIGFYLDAVLERYVRCKKKTPDDRGHIYCQYHRKRQEDPGIVVRDLAFLSLCLEESIRLARDEIRIDRRKSMSGF